jgi:gluconolactonase
MRFRTHQLDAGHSLLQAKIWADGAAEPTAWQVSASDDTPALQGVTGGVAVDSWNSNTAGMISAHTRIDDIEVESLCNPIELRGNVDTVAESFQFTEGPDWRGNHALDGMGRLLAAEHGSRSVTRTEIGGGITALVSTFQGMRLNSPNDIAVASDGTLYFTDPDYGLANPLVQRELAFNGVFRIAPGGGLSAEWQGVVGQNEPNGIALSPDESTVYVTDTQAGALLAFDRAANGVLSNRRTLASGLVIPDGMCIDDDGNVYVATWANTIEIVAPDGAGWGSIPVPRQATNCAFGGAARQTLYVTAHEGVYRVQMPVAGTPY